MLRRLAPVLVIALALASPSVAPAQTRSRGTVGALDKGNPEAEALLERLRKAQAATTTMRADFRQVKEDELFAQPSVQSGKFSFSGPDRFRWDYAKPEQVIVLVTKDSFQRYLPKQKLLRQMDLSKNRRRVFNYFGIGSDVEVLRRHFDMKIDRADVTHPGTEKLQLTGKRRRVQKRLAALEMWIDNKTSLPAVIKITMADGGTTLWEFSDIEVNPKLADETFALNVPKGTVVQSEDDPSSPLMDALIEEEPSSTSTLQPAPTR